MEAETKCIESETGPIGRIALVKFFIKAANDSVVSGDDRVYDAWTKGS